MGLRRYWKLAFVVLLPLGGLGALATQQLTAQAAGCDSWTNASGGDWFTPTNWSSGVPTVATDACIGDITTGTYTVVMNNTASVNSLKIGGASGTQTLSVLGRNCCGNATLTSATDILVNPHGVLFMTGDTGGRSDFVTSGTLTNNGTVTADSTGANDVYLRANITNGTGANLNINTTTHMDSVGGTTTLDNSGGTITVSSSKSFLLTNGSILTNTSGTITNNGSINLSSSILNEKAGSVGPNALVLDTSTLNDSGTGSPFAATFVNTSDTLTGNIAAGQNITLLGRNCCGDVAVTVSGNLTNAGTLTLDGDAGGRNDFLIASGTITNTGSIVGTGTSSNVDYLRANIKNNAGGTITLNAASTNMDGAGAPGATMLTNNGGSITTAATDTFTISGGSTLANTSGSVTNSGAIRVVSANASQVAGTTSGHPVVLDSSALSDTGTGVSSYQFVNSTNTFTGNIAASQNIIVLGRNVNGDASVTFTGDSSNAGTITLQGDSGGRNDILNVATSHVLTNANLGKIVTGPNTVSGTDTAYLRGNITNNTGAQIEINEPTQFDNSGAVSGSPFLLDNEGGTLLTDATRTLQILNGAGFTNGAGTVTNNGTLYQNTGTAIEAAGTTTANPVTLDSVTLNDTGSGASSYQFINASNTLSGNVAAGQTITLLGRNCCGDASVTVSGNLNNAGTITMITDAGGGRSQLLSGSGTLHNTGTINLSPPPSGINNNYTRINISNDAGGQIHVTTPTHMDGGGGFGATTLTNNGGTITTSASGSLSFTGSSGLTNTAGTITNSGTVYQNNGTAVEAAGTTTGNPVILETVTLNDTGSGASSYQFINTGNTLSGNVAAGQTISILGKNCCGNAAVSWTGAPTNNGTIKFTGDLGGRSDTLTLAGTLVNGPTGTVLADNTGGNAEVLNANVDNHGQLQVLAGETLNITGTYAQEADGILRPQVSGTSAGKLAVSGAVTLGGTLAVDTVTPPSTGAAFTVATYLSETGTFAKVVGNYTAAVNSGSVVITAKASGPKVTSVTPNRVGQGTKKEAIVVKGTGFVTGDTVAFTASGVTINSVTVKNSKEIDVVATFGPTAGPYHGFLTVTAPSSSQAFGDFFIQSAPTPTSATPSVHRGTSVTVTVHGTGFQPGAKVTVAVTGITVGPTTFVDANTLTVKVTVANTVAKGTYTLTVTNVDEGKGSAKVLVVT